ncbi:hypothetical protein LX64_02146 [Chitinophaga skermanii]|uniref:Uncharacterized protein n=1 Tax=Chitinophaga skermanii TaxID=331697 RepID=A0A327QZC4_9BACT|nr:hypothetical protein LX64_02146 [Chitinophaga skermanii]
MYRTGLINPVLCIVTVHKLTQNVEKRPGYDKKDNQGKNTGFTIV